MKNKSNVVAFVPMRAGSKGIPNKNIKYLSGKPLFFWSINEALKSNVFERIVVSTESDLIFKEVRKWFTEEEVKLFKRSEEFAADESSTEDVINEFIKVDDVQNLCLIQVTNPFVKSSDFKDSWEKYVAENYDSLLSGTISKDFIWDLNANPLNYDFNNRPRRQDYEGQFKENGSFYFFKRSLFEKNRSRLGGIIGLHTMDEMSSFEIDEPDDWLIVEMLLQRRQSNQNKELTIPKAIVLDVDGTLTDGKMYYSPDGGELKAFHTCDAHGLEGLRNLGIKVCVITGESSKAVGHRMKKMNIIDYFPGIKNKLPVLKKWLDDQNIDFKDIVYGGDDLGDLECMQKAGQSFCPIYAHSQIKDTATYICSKRGGDGAVREYIDRFIST